MNTLDEHLLFERHRRLFLDTKEEVIKTLYKKYYSEIIKSELKEGICFDKPLQDVYNKAMEIRKQNVKDEYYFITLCPYEQIDINSVIKVVDKIIKKKWMKDYIYVYEQRQSETNKPYYGIHVHFIVKRDVIAKSDVIREVYNTSKNICGSPQSIDVKLLKNRNDLDVRINYLLGAKSTEEKQDRQKIDKIFRQEYKLNSYYIVGNIWDGIIPTNLLSVS